MKERKKNLVSRILKNELVFCCFLIFSIQTGHAEVRFDRLGGSDLGMGVGARAMGMGGAFVSVADDASAIFWNPAGLTQLAENQFLLSADPVEDFSGAVWIYRPTFSFLESYRFTVGIGYINRLSFKGDSGTGDWSGNPSHLLDMAMIDVADDFQGSVDSRTYDFRLSLAFIPPRLKKTSVGVNFIHIS